MKKRFIAVLLVLVMVIPVVAVAATYYHVSTLTRVDGAGYRVSLQSVSLQNGALQIQTIASEFGNYGIYAEQGTPEAVFDHAETRQGNELSRSAFSEFSSKFAAGYGAGAAGSENPAERHETAAARFMAGVLAEEAVTRV